MTPRVLSLGGGLDSFAMLVEGINRSDRPDVVVFIDVGHPDGRKLSIMAYSSVKQAGVPLDRWVATPYRPQRDRKPCPVCRRAVRATKATGCGYLEDAAPAALAA